MQRIRITTRPHGREYEVIVGYELLNQIGKHARSCLGDGAGKVAVISNPTVSSLYAAGVFRSLKREGFIASKILVGDGERSKNLSTVEHNLKLLSANNFERTDAVLALGGGVVGDIAGFTAAIYQRGIRFIYAPTTLLAQVDSSVGGKTGVNLAAGKNLVGSFHQPAGVVTDVATLQTLPRRELIAGLYECIKQGAVGGRPLFDRTSSLITRIVSKSSVLPDEMADLISAHCKFKASIVKNDEKEKLNGTTRQSRRILNFGHTVGHALESITNYRRFRHGEAVGLGMLVAAEISNRLGLLKTSELDLLKETVRQCGPMPRTADLNYGAVLKAITLDKKSVSGVVQWVLLEGIGKPRIVSGNQIGAKVIRESLRNTLKQAATVRS